MKIPTAKEISPKFGTDYEGNDERYARLHFEGKDLDEAEVVIRRNSLYYGQEIYWMGPVAFRYYIIAFVRYLQSEHSKDDPDAINCFLDIVHARVEQSNQDVEKIAAELVSACRYILINYDKFGADPNIYGNLRLKFESLMEKLDKLYAENG